MGNINKTELLEGVRHIIDEGFNTESNNFDNKTKFNIRKYVQDLIEEGHKNPELMNYLIKYDEALNNGTKDFMIFEQFGNGLIRFAKANKSVKSVIESMNKTLSEDGAALIGFQLIEKIEEPYVKDDVTNTFNAYINDKCAETRNDVIEALEPLFMVNDPIAMKINLLLTEDSSMSANFLQTDYVTEEQTEQLSKKLQAQRNRKKADEIFEKVERYIEEKLNNEEKQKLIEKQEYCLNAIANKQGLNLLEHINNILHSPAGKNERLKDILLQYTSAINQGAYEERLYETFIYNISKYNYLLPVDKTIKSLNEKVDKNREEITLTKILEEMSDDHTSFIYVDLIQEDVARYVKEPNAINRVQLRNALMPYASDPYINEMFNIIYADNTRKSNEISEQALTIKEQVNIIRENATVSNIYTPVQYISENECVFNVNGLFYIKKGNNISKLNEQYVDQLNDKFIELCQLVNDPHVTINEDHIILQGHDKYATIYEGYVDIFGHKESRESLRNLREMCMKYDDYDTNFYIMCSCLLENFNNIAKVDWAKHVTLNDNHNISADLFKLNENIFLTLHDDSIAKHTLFRNINPIFCKNKLNEHMGINVSSLFADLLPSQDKIILKLNETKNAYEDSIEKYEDMIAKLKDALKNASDENKDKLNDAIKDAKDKLDDIKSEYKDWQKQADELTGKESDDEDDEDVIREKPNEPMSDEEVEDKKDELSQPLDIYGEYDETDDGSVDSQEFGSDKDDDEEFDEIEDSDDDEFEDSDDDEISDDEFQNYLDNDSDDEPEYDMDDSDDESEYDMDDSDNETEYDIDDSDDENTEYDDEDYNAEKPEYVEDSDEDVEDEEQFKEISFNDENTEDKNTETEEPELTDDDVYETPSDEEIDNMASQEAPEDEYMGDEATDEFGGDTEDPMEINKELPEVPENTPQTAEDIQQNYQPEFSYKIADVMFDENVKENIKEKSGSVIVIVPMIDGTGKKYVENKTIEFYISEEGMPILDNEPMTNELYAAVIDAIKNHPDYQLICNTAEPANEEGATVAALNKKYDDSNDLTWEEEYIRDGNEEDKEQFKVGYTDDETQETEEDDKFDLNYDDEDDDEEVDEFGFKKTDFDDEKPNDPVLTYKSGDTEIELPAANADNTEIPESVKPKHNKKLLKENIKITPIFNKNKSGKRFF